MMLLTKKKVKIKFWSIGLWFQMAAMNKFSFFYFLFFLFVDVEFYVSVTPWCYLDLRALRTNTTHNVVCLSMSHSLCLCLCLSLCFFFPFLSLFAFFFLSAFWFWLAGLVAICPLTSEETNWLQKVGGCGGGKLNSNMVVILKILKLST
jgi:hypothetical protein